MGLSLVLSLLSDILVSYPKTLVSPLRILETPERNPTCDKDISHDHISFSPGAKLWLVLVHLCLLSLQARKKPVADMKESKEHLLSEGEKLQDCVHLN